MKTIFLGNYWQSNCKNKEPIEWLVLKEDDEKMYIISKYCLDCVPYSDGHKTVWKNSLMRKWLNNYFLNEAFSFKEQDRIVLTDIKTQAGGWVGPMLDCGTPVQDKVFLPSIAEAILYFGSTEWHDIVAEQKRIARPTLYAYEHCCWISRLEYSPLSADAVKYVYNNAFDSNNSYWHFAENFFAKKEPLEEDTPQNRWSSSWYLRSPGNGIVCVEGDGTINSDYSKNFERTTIRPAMWIKK